MIVEYKYKLTYTYLILGAVYVFLISPGAQSPGLGWPLRKASACSGSFADSDLRSALNSFLLGLSGSLLLGELRGRPPSAHALAGADREYCSDPVVCGFALSATSLSENAKYDGLSITKFIIILILMPKTFVLFL